MVFLYMFLTQLIVAVLENGMFILYFKLSVIYDFVSLAGFSEARASEIAEHELLKNKNVLISADADKSVGIKVGILNPSNNHSALGKLFIELII